MTEIMPRKRGGQPGNQNARKHGYYAVFNPVVPESELADAAALAGIDDEIALVRVKLKHVLEKDPDNISAVIRATNTLARLLRLQNRINVPSF